MCVLLFTPPPGHAIIADTAGLCSITPGIASASLGKNYESQLIGKAFEGSLKPLQIQLNLSACSPGLSPTNDAVPTQWPGWPNEFPFLSQPPKVTVRALRESEGS